MPTIVSKGAAAASAYGFGVTAGVNPFTPVTHTYSTAGSGTETIPYGASTLVIESWAGGGGGIHGTGGSEPEPGNSGGAGGYSRTSISVAQAGGLTMSYTVGAAGLAGGGNGGSSSIASGTFSLTTMSDGGGGGASSLRGGTGGTASGGSVVNTAGGAGGFGDPTTNPGVVGLGGASYGAGGAGGPGAGGGNAGGAGAVKFAYS